MRARRVLLAALAALAALLLLGPTAAAHANYLSSEPRQGARLGSAPAYASVTLSEEIDARGSSLVVHDQQGRRVDGDDLRVTGAATPTLTVSLGPLGPGPYAATWRALSTIDGHVTSGSFGFAVGDFEPPAAHEAAAPLPAPAAASRALLYAGFCLTLGSVAFAVWVETRPHDHERDRRLGRVVLAGTVFLVAGSAGLFFDTYRQADVGFWRYLGTGVGRLLFLRFVVAVSSLAAAGWLTARPSASRPRWILAAAPVLVLAMGTATLAHASALGLIAAAGDLAHILAGAVWIGGLVLLIDYLVWASHHATLPDVRRTGLRFSRIALPSVIVIALSGIASSLAILGPSAVLEPLKILDSPYGLFLAGKIALAGLMVALAGINRFVFLGTRPGRDTIPPEQGPQTPQPARIGEEIGPTARRRTTAFYRTAAVEASLGVAVLVCAGFLTALSPPAAVAAGPDALTASETGDNYAVTLVVEPRPRAGASSNVSIYLLDTETGNPVTEAERVRIEINNTQDPESAPASYATRPDGDGWWRAGDILFVRGGNYTAKVTIQTQKVYLEEVVVRFVVL
ncbi:MAG: copper resistance protein CopC/CopD [Euryarchaeota archaeon]|nr:copper resistance protein CopC/CopD [Euryarchaeota archaeon]